MNWDRLLADAESGVGRIETELGRLRAENKRLRAALELMRNTGDFMAGVLVAKATPDDAVGKTLEAWREARAALEGQP